MAKVLPVLPQYFVRVPGGIPLLFLAAGVEYRGKASRGWCKGHKARSWTLGNEGSL